MQTYIVLGIFALIAAGIVVFIIIKKKKDTPVTPEVAPWTPPQTPGLHLIFDNANSKREFFCGTRIPEGLLLGDYGLQVGGAKIQKWNGLTNVLTDELQTIYESIFGMINPGDDLPVAIAEHYGAILKRDSAGKWVLKFSTERNADLALKIVQKADQSLWVIINGFDNQLSYLVKSTDLGNAWQKDFQFPAGFELCGMYANGNELILGGKNGEKQVILDGTGRVIVSWEPEGEPLHYQYWAVIKDANGVINAGTWNATNMADGSYINAIRPDDTGQQCVPPFAVPPGKTYTGQIGAFIQAMGIKDGVRYAVLSRGWGQEGTAVLLSANDPYNWTFECEIPCPMIVEMSFSDGGVFLYGGCHEGYGLNGYGRVYFYKF